MTCSPTRQPPPEEPRSWLPKWSSQARKPEKVVKVHATARFVVLNFPVGALPEQGATLGAVSRMD